MVLSMAEVNKPKQLLTIEPDDYAFSVSFSENDKYLGDFLASDDGYYNFWPNSNMQGYWAANVLRELADELDKINKN